MDNVFDENALLSQAPQGAGVLQYRSNLRVWFYLHADKDELKSRKEGRSIYVDSIYYSTKAEGTKDFVSVPATPEFIEQHPNEWAEFMKRRNQNLTSIKSLPKITPAVLMTLHELKIFTIEDFAASTPPPELVAAHAVAQRWVGAINGTESKAAKKGGWPKGKPRKGHVENIEAAA